MKKKIILLSFAIFLILLLFGLTLTYILFSENSNLAEDTSRVVIVPRGKNVNQIAELLKERDVIANTRKFVWSAKILRRANHLKAGRYEIIGGKSSSDIVEIFYQGRVSSIRVTIPEGLDSRRIASIYSEKLNIDTQKFIGLVHDSSFAASIGDLTGSLEGFLFPDTYDFLWQQDESGLARRMVEHFLEVMPDSILKIHNNDPAGFRNAVTLASIIQGEAMIEEEMPTISAVYHNRLRRNMLLQADPTLQYIITDGPRRLTNEDKKIDSPYNTYLYPGLPPGPINNPGLSAILAAIHPADAPYLYFVANGDGTHTFTRSLSDHLRAKENLDRIRRDFHMKQKLRKEN